MRPVVRCVVNVSLLFVALAVFAAGCGGGSDAEESAGPNIVDAGEVSIQLPDDFDPNAGDEDEAAAEAAVDASEGESAGSEVDPAEQTDAGDDAEDAAEAEVDEPEEDEDAIPLAEDDTPAIVGLIEAFEVFTSCIDDEGFEFEGAPGQDGAVAEDFDPAYLGALQQCAAESNIVQAIQASQAADAALTPPEIEERNVAFLEFVDCLELRGWEVAEIVPDARGLLQAGQGNGGLTPPPGVDFFDSNDIAECVQIAAEATDTDIGG